MEVPDLVELFTGPLDELEIPYMVTGGVAAVVYGDPRFARGVDVVLELDESTVGMLEVAFGRDAFHVPPTEELLREARRPRGGHVQIVHRDTSLRADLYLLDDEPLHRWGFERRQPIPVGKGTMWLAPIEYVIVRKLQYFRESGSDGHLRDVAHMCRISSDEVDRMELIGWVERLGLAAEWEAAEDVSA
jgi:hypothetical protein